MQGYVALKNGWVSEIQTDETGLEYDARVASGDVPVARQDVIRKLMSCQAIMFWDGKQFCQVKNPRDIWKRIRLNNFHGIAASRGYQRCIDALDPNFPDIPAEAVIEMPPLEGKSREPSFETEFKPGLKVTLSTEDDLGIWESSMIGSGLYSKDEAWQVGSEWLTDTMTWPVKVTWKDKPLQIEMFHLGAGNSVYGGFAAHIDRTRPGWFWKQMSLPVLRALYAEGYENIISQIRIDKPDYANFLVETYGHEILKKTDKAINLRLNIKEAIKNMGDWPARRTLGIDWKWEEGDVLVREATEDDLPGISAAIEESWGDNPRKQLAVYNFDVYWNLDSAAILLTFENGVITEVRTFRERKDPSINLRANLVRTITGKPKLFDLSLIACAEWEKAVGYKTTSFILETKLFDKVKDVWSKRGWTVYSQNADITECRMSIGDALNAKKQAIK